MQVAADAMQHLYSTCVGDDSMGLRRRPHVAIGWIHENLYQDRNRYMSFLS